MRFKERSHLPNLERRVEERGLMQKLQQVIQKIS